MLYLKVSIGLVIVRRVREVHYQRPSSTGDPHEQFVEHQGASLLLLSPKEPGTESTEFWFKNSFLNQVWWWRKKGEDNNKNSFCFSSLKKPKDRTIRIFTNSLGKSNFLSLAMEVAIFLSLHKEEDKITNELAMT